MIVHNMGQYSPEWWAARLGIPTASRFDEILTPTGKLSTQADKYMMELLAEWLSGGPNPQFETEWMRRGTELEPEARKYYAFATDAEIVQVGFITRDDGMVGASPDALVNSDGLSEIKCPAPHTHVGYLLGAKLATQYIPQVQGQLWIAEREWCDWISYHPTMPPCIVRVNRDDGYIKALASAVDEFLGKMLAKRELLRKYKEAA